jgi:MFS family permease
MALSTSSWSIGWIAGPALGALVLQQKPLALWPIAAGFCLAAGAGGLLLERRLPENVRRTPSDIPVTTPPEPDPDAEPEASDRSTVEARASG